jgi:hypothetical protein
MNNHESHLVPIERPKDRTDIRWQVHEWSFLGLPNLYEAVAPMIEKINTLFKDPSIPEDNKWLFREKDGQPPAISFLAYDDKYHNHRKICLLYDEAFSVHVFSAGQQFLVIPFGHIYEAIYYNYWISKLGSTNVPPIPNEVLQGYLTQQNDSFVLNSIFLNGWDGRQRYDAAMAVRGFSTKDYDTIYFLENYSPEYRRELIEELLRKHPKLPQPEEKRKQLLAYDAPKSLPEN